METQSYALLSQRWELEPIVGQCGVSHKCIGLGVGCPEVLGMVTSKKSYAFMEIIFTGRELDKISGSQILAYVRIIWRAC